MLKQEDSQGGASVAALDLRYEAVVRSQTTDVLTGELIATGGGTVGVSGAWALFSRVPSLHFGQSRGGWAVSRNNSSYAFTLVRVQFTYVPDEPLLTRVRGGFVVLDPDRYWLIRKARTEGDWGKGGTGEIVINSEFDTSLDALPLPAHHQTHWMGTMEENEPVHNVREMWFDRWKRSSGEENDYRLRAFGLPEP